MNIIIYIGVNIEQYWFTDQWLKNTDIYFLLVFFLVRFKNRDNLLFISYTL